MVFTLFLILIVGLALGVPIAVALGFATIFPGISLPGFPASMAYIVRNVVSALDSTPILAIPLFILSGNIMTKGKISDKLFNFFAYFIGDFPAGIPITAIVTCLFYGAISGSGVATTAAVADYLLPVSLGMAWSTAALATAGASAS